MTQNVPCNSNSGGNQRFYVLWDDDNANLEGEFAGSAAKNGPYADFGGWRLGSNPFYRFEFETNQSTYDLFVMMHDRSGSDTKATYGIRVYSAGHSGAEQELQFQALGTELDFTAAKLISGDPKITISTATTVTQGGGSVPTYPSSMTLTWQNDTWTAIYTTESDVIAFESSTCTATLSLDNEGKFTVTIRDYSGDASKHGCALYITEDQQTGTVAWHGGYGDANSLDINLAANAGDIFVVNIFQGATYGDHPTSIT